MKKRTAMILLAFLTVALVTGIALAGSSANYAIPWEVIGRGGNEMASTNYGIKSTSGQAVIGPGSSPNYDLGAGYWYGMAAAVFDIYLPLVFKNLNP